MRICQIHISGFRSICPSVKIDFDQPEKGAPKVVEVGWPEVSFAFELRRDPRGYDLTGIVGPNNAGKSNVLRTLLLFFSNLDSDETSVKVDQSIDFHCCDPEKSETTEAQVCIELLFELSSGDESDSLQDYLVTDQKGENEETELLCLGCVWELDGSAHWYVRRELGKSTVDEIGANLKSVALHGIAKHMPRFYWLPTGADTSKEQQIRGSKYLKRLIDDVVGEIKGLQQVDDDGVEDLTDDDKELRRQLVSTQESLQDLRDQLEEFKQLPSPLNELADLLALYMQPIMPGIRAWFEYTSALPTDYWQWLNVSMIRLDDGWPTSISEKGHGAQRTFAIALLRAYAYHKARRIGEHPYLIAIEEPEIYMHPHVARALSSTLQSLAEGGQVLFSTHSPVFVQALDWENLVLVRKPSGESCLRQIPVRSLDEKQRDIIRRNVDAKECELFFARHVLLVEGPTERFAIPGFVRTLKRDPNHPLGHDLDEMGISIVDVGGASKFEPFLVLLRRFDISTSILVDADAIGSVVSQMRFSELLTDQDVDEFNGYGKDLGQKRKWLKERGCFVLDGDFETEITRSLSNERIWEIINEARLRRGKEEVERLDFPGEIGAQIEEMVQDWMSSLWDGVKHSVAKGRRDYYKGKVVPVSDSVREWLGGIANELIAGKDWAADSREKWLALKMARLGKPLVGLVLGEKLISEDIQRCAGLNDLLSHLAEYAPGTNSRLLVPR